jgi:hypothetical protein
VHTTEPLAAPHIANIVTNDKRWTMEDAVYSSLPRFILFRSEKKEESGVKVPMANLALALQPQDLIACLISEFQDSDDRDSR